MPTFAAQISDWTTSGSSSVWSAWNQIVVISNATTTVTLSDNRVWSRWNDQTGCPVTLDSTLATTDSSTNAIVWTTWNSSSTNTVRISVGQAAATWDSWVRNGSSITAALRPRAARIAAPPPLTREDHIRLEAERARRREEQARILAKQAKASDRAEKLLRECLSPRQAAELQRQGHFHVEVIGLNGAIRRYRIERGRSGNVKQVDEQGRVLKRLCLHPIESVPDADTMLAQKLLLETDEEQFLQTANHWPN